MAKALLGHIGNTDPRLVSEVRRLRRRVKDLEAEIVRLQVENDAVGAPVPRDDLMALEVEHNPSELVGSSA